MRELLLPSTDAGVLVQVVVLGVVFAAGALAVRRNRDLRWFVGGLATFTAALLALRTLH